MTRTVNRTAGEWRRTALLVGVMAALLGWVAGCNSPGERPATTPSTSYPTQPDRSVPASEPATTTAPATAAAARRPVIYSCDQQAVTQPDAFLLFCGDAGARLEGLTWSDWGQPVATATGQMWQKSCLPSCVAGNVIPYDATVTVSGLSGGSYHALRVAAPAAPQPTEDFTLDREGPLVVQNG
jgi:hypothetical protein